MGTPAASRHLPPHGSNNNIRKETQVFKIYGTDDNNQIRAQETADLVAALRISKEMRDAGYSFVTMASENPEHVGKHGVDTIADGKTPDGHDYDWSKAGRAGKPRASDRVITKKDF